MPDRELDVDSALYLKVRQLYLDRNCWTWEKTYEPPPVSNYLQLVRDGELLIVPWNAPPWSSRPLKSGKEPWVPPNQAAGC